MTILSLKNARARFSLGALLTIVAPAAAGEPLTIADLAPKNSILVVGVDDSGSMFESFDRTGFKAIWDSKEFQDWIEKQGKEAMTQYTTDLESLGLKWEDLKRPSGPMGMAAWFTGAEAGDDGGMPPPALLMMADYGDDADNMDQKIIKALERADEKKSIDLSESRHEGVTIYTSRFLNQGAGGGNLRIEEDEIDALGLLGRAGGGVSYPEMHYARVDRTLLLCSEIAGIENAIDRLKGDRAPSVGDVADFNDARRQLGAAQGYAVLLGNPLRDWINESAKDLPEDSVERTLSTLTGVLGLNDLRAGAMGVRFDADNSMAEQSYAVLASKKTGLVALFDTPAMPFDPPSFAGADASAITMMQFNFSGVIPLAMQVVQAMPPDIRGMVEPQLQAGTMFLGPILANLGPEVCIVSHLARPIAADSQRQVWAIRMRDANALQQSVAGIMPMVGFESRDFQGNQIWSPAGGGMLPADSMAIGMGFGWVIIGPTKGVEDLMRQAGAADNPKIADEKSFKAARRSVDDKGIAYGFWRIGPTLDWYDWYSRNIEKIMEAQTNELFGNEPPADDDERRWREDARRGMMESLPVWVKNPPPMEVIRRNLGDTVMQARSTPEGFEGRSIMLRPEKN